MTWKELKELIEQMSPEEQNKSVIIWTVEYDIPRPANRLSKRYENLYYIHGLDAYCDEKYIKDCSEEDIELVLGKGEYCLKV